MKKMDILVIDDIVNHQKTAKQVFGNEHNLTVVGSYDDALAFLAQKRDEEKFVLLKNQYKEQGVEDYLAKAKAEALLPYWDVVLCDLLMPAGKDVQGEKGLKYVGQEMPVGWSFAITAALRGAKYVAVVTNMNHHDHPASAMLDSMSNTVFDLNGAKALFTNDVCMIGIEDTRGVCMDCLGTGEKFNGSRSYQCYTCQGTKNACSKKGKDWLDILNRLTEPKSLEES